MTLFKNTQDQKLYIIEDWGKYGLFAFGYFCGNKPRNLSYDDIGVLYIPVAIV